MSSSTPVKPVNAVESLAQMAALHGARSHDEFFGRLKEALRAILGRTQFTFVARETDRCHVLYSTRLKSLERRLTPPPVAPAEILAFFPEATVESIRSDPASCVQVEGVSHPVVAAWRVGIAAREGGFLLFHDDREIGSDEETQAVAAELRRNASVAYYKLTDRETTQEQVDLYQAKLEAINEVGELLASLDVDVLLTKLMELALYIVSGQVGSIILRVKDEEVSRVEWGLPLELAQAFRDREGRVVYKKVMAEGRPALILDFGNNSDYRIDGYDVNVDSYLCIPLTSKNRILGVINLVNSIQEGSGFSELDREILMTISGLAATSIENALLHSDSLEKERYRQSLSIARAIQRRFYPSEPPQALGLDIAWRNESCDETGGDYFDFIPGAHPSLIIAVGDVSGHGIGAALLMASARAGLRAAVTHGDPLSDVVCSLNDRLEQDMEQERFMTLFLASLDTLRKDFQFVNAGHDAPCVYRAQRDEVEELGSTGMPLGLFAGVPFGTGSIEGLVDGDAMIFTTDGVWEVNDADGKMLGKERLKEIFHRQARDPQSTAERIADGILSEVANYTGGSPPRDDVTLVVVRCEASG